MDGDIGLGEQRPELLLNALGHFVRRFKALCTIEKDVRVHKVEWPEMAYGDSMAIPYPFDGFNHRFDLFRHPGQGWVHQGPDGAQAQPEADIYDNGCHYQCGDRVGFHQEAEGLSDPGVGA